MPFNHSQSKLSLISSRLPAVAAIILAFFVSGDVSTQAGDALVPKLLKGQELREEMQANPTEAKSLAIDHGVNWCQTERVYLEKIGSSNRSAAVCQTEGDCDIPANRNIEIPDPSDPPKIIRLKFNVFANDDGSNLAATQVDVDAQVVQLNADFAPSRIQFEYQTEVINSTQYRVFSDNEEGGMKGTYAEKTNEQMNIYVVAINAGYIGVGTFPWDGQALGTFGGIIIDDGFFGAGNKTLTHEVGHCLGLWHTHHGVYEVSPCSSCWEFAGDSSDITGDFCADTEPTPRNFNCSSPGGTDQCNGNPWGATDPQNYMGYAPDNCYTEFTPHQWGRMQCWTDAELEPWQSGVNFIADTTFGQAPLDVQFDATTFKSVNNWIWDFGDGNGSAIQSPAHSYAIPGVRDVQVTIDATDGSFSQLRRSYVAAYADTLLGSESIGAPSATVKVSVYVSNAIPLTQLRIPFHWSGPMGLEFNSASTMGLRTEYLDIQSMTSLDPINKRGVYVMSANVINGTAPLAPDTGAVLELTFDVPASPGSAPNPILFDDWGANTLNFTYGSHSYSPVMQAGQVSACSKAGDANGSGDITIADVTYLIARIFTGGPEPTPPNAGDATCNGSTSIEDVTFLITHIFAGGPAPCDCAP